MQQTTRRDNISASAGRGIGWTLVIALAIAVSIAISMAIQLGPEHAAPQPPNCGGLFSECCPETDSRPDGDHDRGLFDAEASFATADNAPAAC